MGTPPTAEHGVAVTELDEEVEGDFIGSRNYCFSPIGEQVPVMIKNKKQKQKGPVVSEPTAVFDSKSVPYRPVALSLRFRLLFVAHPKGFCVTRTSDVMSMAKSVKAGGNCQAIEEFCLVHVPMEHISSISLSSDEALLAVCVANKVHFFAVIALVHKDQKPSFSVSLDGSNSIKDMIWAKKAAKAYVILSDDRKLYHGSCQGPLTLVMNDVDCVDWSSQENCVVVTKKNTVIILSPQFKEKFRFLLSFESVIDDSDATQVIKVDSVRWIRPDCIAVGCVNFSEAEEGNYFVQFITSRGSSINETDESSKPIVISFDDIMLDCCTDVPDMNGMHLLLSYLDHYGLAFVSLRNMARQVGLICWHPENGNSTAQASIVDILKDSWTLKIDCEDNENNVIIGLAVDKLSQDENARFTVGDKEKEVSPCCVIACLTIDGNISLFHFASAVGVLTSQEVDGHDEEDDVCVTNKSELPQVSSLGSFASSAGVSPSQKGRVHDEEDVTCVSNKSELSQISYLGSEKKTEPPFSTFEHHMPIITEIGRTVSTASTQYQVLLHQSYETRNTASKPPDSQISIDKTEKKIAPAFSTSLHHERTITDLERTGSAASTRNHLMPQISSLGSEKKIESPSSTVEHPTRVMTEIGRTVSAASSRNQGSLDRTGVSRKPFQQELKKEFIASSFPSKGQHTAVHAPRRLGNVAEMTGLLDNLLEEIEENGRFTYSSVSSQSNSIKELEDSLWALSDRCRIWRESADDKLMEVKLLLDKTVQVITRKANVEKILREAMDSRYWELWDGQELSCEMELKLNSIMQGEQVLTNQLIELEKHFNTLEFNRFGENRGSLRNQMALQNVSRNSRQVKSLQSLRNTMHSQLEAAEHLSGCLSEQMASLRIESSEKHEMTRQLFESLDLHHSVSSLSPPAARILSTPSARDQILNSLSLDARADSKVTRDSVVANGEPKSVRRQHYSLDQSWTSADVPKTTVKRMAKESNEKGRPRSVLFSDKQHLILDMEKKSETRFPHNAPVNSLSGFRTRGTTTLPGEQFSENSSRSSGQTDLPDLIFKAPSSVSLPSFPLGGIQSGESPLRSNAPSNVSFPSLPLGGIQSDESPLRSNTPSKVKFPSFPLGGFQSGESPLLSNTPFSVSFPSLPLVGIQSGETPLRSTDETSKSSLFSNDKIRSIGAVASKSSLASNEKIHSAISVDSKLGQNSTAVPHSLSTKYPVAPSPVVSVAESKEATPHQGKLPSNLSLLNGKSNLSPESSSAPSSESLVSRPLNVVPDLKKESPPPLVKNAVPLSPSETVINSTGLQVPQVVFPTSETPLKSKIAPSLWSAEGHVSSGAGSSSVTSAHTPEPPTTPTASTVDLSHVRPLGAEQNAAPDQMEEMEEEDPETSKAADISLGSLDSFGIGSKPSPTPQPTKNPFGVTPNNASPAFTTFPSYSMPTSGGELFRPSSFNFASLQPPAPVQPAPTPNISAGFNTGMPGQVSVGGFGQPSAIGVGQQAMGSVLGAFGQSRQLGQALPGSSFTSASGFGVPTGGGAAPSGGFASLSSGFGGFAGAASGGRGFSGAATTSQVPAGGGFGAFSSNQQGAVGGGFSAFSGTSGAGRPPSQLFTQMRK